VVVDWLSAISISLGAAVQWDESLEDDGMASMFELSGNILSGGGVTLRGCAFTYDFVRMSQNEIRSCP
jgi:hypothetical protein